MKNIQEILLQCGGIGKLILGDEEIDITVSSVQSEIRHLDGYITVYGERKTGENVIVTNLKATLGGNDFLRIEGK